MSYKLTERWPFVRKAVDTPASLPAGETAGTMRVVLSNLSIYTSDGTSYRYTIGLLEWGALNNSREVHTYSQGRISKITVYNQNGTPSNGIVYTIDYTYSSNRISSSVIKYYMSSTESPENIKATITESYTFAGSDISNISRVVS